MTEELPGRARDDAGNAQLTANQEKGLDVGAAALAWSHPREPLRLAQHLACQDLSL